MTPTWPAEIIGRYLTAGGATVDITPAGDSRYRLRCTGAFCDLDITQQAGWDEHSTRTTANNHASSCRAMPRPDGAAETP